MGHDWGERVFQDSSRVCGEFSIIDEELEGIWSKQPIRGLDRIWCGLIIKIFHASLLHICIVKSAQVYLLIKMAAQLLVMHDPFLNIVCILVC